MKDLSCSNCGSGAFYIEQYTYKCKYCGSMIIREDVKQQSTVYGNCSGIFTPDYSGVPMHTDNWLINYG